MGEQFLKKQAKGFRHRHDMARDRFAAPNLLATMRTNGTATDCTCRVIGTAPAPDVGAGVVLRTAGDARAEVICGNAIVGTVDGADVQALGPAFTAGAGVLRGTVQRGAVLGGLYTVRVTEGAP
jgi:hypothetical protein